MINLPYASGILTWPPCYCSKTAPGTRPPAHSQRCCSLDDSRYIGGRPSDLHGCFRSYAAPIKMRPRSSGRERLFRRRSTRRVLLCRNEYLSSISRHYHYPTIGSEKTHQNRNYFGTKMPVKTEQKRKYGWMVSYQQILSYN